MRAVVDDPWQLPGEFIIAPGGRIALAASSLTPAIRRVVAYESAPVLREPDSASADLALRLRARLDAGESPAGIASAAEIVLEGLHLNRRLNKERRGGRIRYAR